MGCRQKFLDFRLITSDVVSLTLPRQIAPRSPAMSICASCNAGPHHGHLAEGSYEPTQHHHHHRSRPTPAGFGVRVRMADLWQRCSQRRGVFRRERVVTGALTPAQPLKPEVAELIRTWKPGKETAPDTPFVRERILPVVRELVTAAAPETPITAWRLLRYVAKMMVWADETIGSLSPTVINPRNIDAFIVAACKHESFAWKHAAITTLNRVGRVVNPKAWEAQASGDKRLSVPTAPYSLPYSIDDEDLIEMACRLPGSRNPAGRLWSVAGPLGAGLRSFETTLAEVGDIHERADGRLVVEVRGHQSRLVPVRLRWTDVVRQAVACVRSRPVRSSNKFILGSNPATAGVAARNLPLGWEGISLSRTRATWLAAHLIAGTSLPALKMLAGSLSENTLHRLCSGLDLRLTAEEAVTEGMGA